MLPRRRARPGPRRRCPASARPGPRVRSSRLVAHRLLGDGLAVADCVVAAGGATQVQRVLAGAAADRAVAVVRLDPVVAPAGFDDVLAMAGVDVIRAAPAEEAV